MNRQPTSTEAVYRTACTTCGTPASVHLRLRSGLDGFATLVTFLGRHRTCAGTIPAAELQRRCDTLRARATGDDHLDRHRLYAIPGGLA